MTHICVRQLWHHWFACSVPSHHRNQFWLIVNRKFESKYGNFFFKKMNLEMSSAKRWSFYLGPKVLTAMSTYTSTNIIWGVLCQKQISRARTSNYIPQKLWDVITCPCPWYLLLAQHSCNPNGWNSFDYGDVIISAMASQITGVSIETFVQAQMKKTSKLRVTGLCEGDSPGTGEFPAQRASNAENVSINLTTSAWICVPVHFFRWPLGSTKWGQNKMADILHTIFSKQSLGWKPLYLDPNCNDVCSCGSMIDNKSILVQSTTCCLVDTNDD